MTIDNKLEWHTHASTVLSKTNQRLYFVRKLASFGVSGNIISLFYRAVIQPVISFCISLWGGNVSIKHKKRINRCIRSASRVSKVEQDNFNIIFENSCSQKLENILEDPSHPLF